MDFEILPLTLNKAYLRVVFATICGLGNLEHGVGHLREITMLTFIYFLFSRLTAPWSAYALLKV